jgi:hypothetical protein
MRPLPAARCITRDMDISDLVIDRQRVHRQMGLQETPMRLRFDHRQRLFDRNLEPAVQPQRQFPQRARLWRLEDEQIDDLLVRK